MNLPARIRTARLSPSETEIARFVLRRGDEVMKMQVQDFADAVHVSRSTVIRFAKALGLSGWKALKLELSKWLDSQQTAGTPVDVNLPFRPGDTGCQIAGKLADLYRDTLQEMQEVLEEDQLEMALNLLAKAEHIHVITAYHNLSLAGNFCDKLLSIGCRAQVAASVQTQDFICCNSNETDAILFISYSGTYHPMAQLMEKSSRQKAKLILITGSGTDAFDDFIQARLRLGGRESRLGRMAQFSSDMEVHFLLDVLYGALLSRRKLQQDPDVRDIGGQLPGSGFSGWNGTY